MFGRHLTPVVCPSGGGPPAERSRPVGFAAGGLPLFREWIICRIRASLHLDSTHCGSLSAIARQYVEAGGFTDKTSCPADRIAETARARAWMALAVSKTGDKGLAVW
jgi:hypothetical protein